jgi:hypothetical protein
MNTLHAATVYTSTSEERKKRAAINQVQVFDEFAGTISGVNFNGLMILDLFASGKCKNPIN